jgi:hypothetical protein
MEASAKWEKYINNSKGKPMRPLHYQAKLLWIVKNKKPRALSLGTGYGKEDIDLMSRGWEVTGVDTEPYVGIHMTKIQKEKKLKGKFIFQNVPFGDVVLTGKYNYIMAFSSLPFGDKKELAPLFDRISKHTSKKAVVAMNLFGPIHTFVKAGKCYSMTEKSITTLLKPNFDILHMERKQFDRPEVNDHWDEIEVIATRK